MNDDSIYELEEAAMQLVTLDNFGVWQLSLVEAAQLIVRDMWYGGEIEAEGIDEEAYDGDLAIRKSERRSRSRQVFFSPGSLRPSKSAD